MNTPPLLLAATLLFWGWQNSFVIPSLVMGLLLEGSRLIRQRWDLQPRDFYRVADLCAALLVSGLAFIYLGPFEQIRNDSRSLIRWIPVLIFPLLLAQVYSLLQRVDLGALFYVIRRQEQRGRQTTRRAVDLSYPALVVIALSASAANIRTSGFYVATSLLTCWVVWANRPRRVPAQRLTLLLLCAGGLGWGIQFGMRALQLRFEAKLAGWISQSTSETRDTYESVTAIGKIGEVKQSGHILLRVQSGPQKDPPMYLYEMSYNYYSGGRWSAPQNTYTPLESPNNIDWRLAESTAVTDSVRIRRAMPVAGLLSQPLGAVGLHSLPVGKLQRSVYGAYYVEECPPLLNYVVQYEPMDYRMAAPDTFDREVPEVEASIMARALEELHLAQLPPAEIVRAVSQFFDGEFRYSLAGGGLPDPANCARPAGQCPYHSTASEAVPRTPLGEFLLCRRAGHCEYFATGAALLLRAAGIPTRYATGYVVDEYSPREEAFIVRGRHAHAWTLAYVDSVWQPIDTTPGVWLENESRQAEWLEPLRDWADCYKFKFAAWRIENADKSYYGWLFLIMGSLVVYLTIRILYGKKSAIPPRRAGASGPGRPAVESPLFALEADLDERGLARLPAETWTAWLARIAPALNDSAIVAELRACVTLHLRLRFQQTPMSEAEKGALAQKVAQWRTTWRAVRPGR